MTLTREDSVKGAHASNIARREKAAARRQRAEVVWRVVSETDDLSPAVLAGALALAEKLEAEATGVEIDDALTALRLAQVLEILHRVHRLASGQSTSNAAHVHLSDEERRARMAQLRGDTPSPDTE